MKLRHILIVLSLLTFLSVTVAGYLFNASLEESAFQTAEREVALEAVRIEKTISSYLTANLKSVRALAGLEELRDALGSPDELSLDRANAILDHFSGSLNVDVCYIIDTKGKTIASSNRNAPDSFVGENFSFRPYWKDAVAGKPSTYMALGVTSGKRGVYHSHPVHLDGGDKPVAAPIGVVVIKSPIESLEKEFAAHYEGTILLTDPEGIVFSSNREEMLFRSVQQLSVEQVKRVQGTKQFGAGPWEWIGLVIGEDRIAEDRMGDQHVVYKLDVDNYPGWSLIYYLNLDAVTMRVSDPVIRAAGPIILSLCFLVGLSVFFLYRRASKDLYRRRQAETALRDAKETLENYSIDLERQVKERTGEITSILRHTPAVVYIKDSDGRYTFINSRHEQLFGTTAEKLRGKTAYDIFPRQYADRFWENDLKVLMDGEPLQVEEDVPLSEGVHTYLSVKFPIYNDAGKINAVCGISTDITQIKRAQDQLRRLSDRIIESQENERRAVSLELHDELGQVLTALRMDAVWLRDESEEATGEGRARAEMMCDLIDKAIDEVRSMAMRLRPGVLDDLGLRDALDWLTSEFDRRTGVECLFDPGEVPAVPDALATAAYRIAQEAITNVSRHSDADRVEVILNSDNGSLLLSVTDNGKGFDDRELAEAEGLGIAGMRERASLVGGVLEIRTQPGEGARVLFRAPLENEVK